MNLDKSSNQRWEGYAYKVVDFVAVFFVWIFTAFAVLLFGGLLFLAGIEFYHAICIGMTYRIPGEASESGKGSLITAIDGLELVFLSPLAYFLTRNLRTQVLAYYNNKPPGAEATAELVEVKSLIVGLLSSVLAADLVGRSISEAGDKLGFSALIELSVLITLCGYYFALHETVKRLRAR